MNSDQTSACFETTNWNLLDALHSDDTSVRDKALQELMRRYWPPVYAWMRQWGLDRPGAEEATQAFFSDVVLQRMLFERATRRKTGLRQLLLAALRNFTIDQWRRRTARIATQTIPAEAFDEEEAHLASMPADREQAFGERWTLNLLEEVLRRCEEQYRGRPTERYWDAFEGYVLRPAITGNEPPPQAQLAEQLGFPSAQHVAVAIRNVKIRCRTILQQLLAEVAADPDCIGEEEAAVMRLLGRA